MVVTDLLSDMSSFNPLNEDAHVVITDVRGSTQAGHAGRGREVNYVAAACISAVLNAFPEQVIPYVFGGDGATFIARPEQLAAMMLVLENVRLMASSQYGLHLRVGAVSVAELRESQAELLMSAKMRGNATFFEFIGSGFVLADRLVKERADNSSETKNQEKSGPVDLSGLSCRLLPFRPLRGNIYTFVIESRLPTAEQDALYLNILSFLSEKDDLLCFSPIQKQNMRRKWLPSSWLIEAKAASIDCPLMRRLKIYFGYFLQNLLTTFVFRTNRNNSVTGQPAIYNEEVVQQNDWIKINGLLTMVLDMSASEFDAIDTHLAQLEAQGVLAYGVHQADVAVMVCQVFSQQPGKHVHFVDGSSCGLAAAAGQLKMKRGRTAA